MKTCAKYILLIEKEATFARLLNDRYYEKYGPCILVTGKGYPDISTRAFVKKLSHQFSLPVLALIDSDPYGLEILLTYTFGSLSQSHDSDRLAVPHIKWLGVRPSDFTRFNVPINKLLPLTDTDYKKGIDLLDRKIWKFVPNWKSELNVMLENRSKAEIQILCCFSLGFLCDEFLPKKISAGDWI